MKPNYLSQQAPSLEGLPQSLGPSQSLNSFRMVHLSYSRERACNQFQGIQYIRCSFFSSFSFYGYLYPIPSGLSTLQFCNVSNALFLLHFFLAKNAMFSRCYVCRFLVKTGLSKLRMQLILNVPKNNYPFGWL